MVNCTFCGKEMHKGTGKIFVKDNGQVLNFCSSKCEKNMLKLKRDSRKFKWTTSYVKGDAPAAKTAAKPKKTSTTPKKK